MKELEKMIKDKLIWDDRIDESQINVSVHDNVATLKGCVSTYPEKITAEIEAQMVPGIKSIINKIEVKFPHSFEIPSDQTVKEIMFCLLDANSEIDSNDVQISVSKGEVVLEGTVNSYWKREKIREIASHTSGIISIKNQIKIVPNEKLYDGEIASLIITSMQNSVYIDATKVNVKVEDGVVTLSGILSSMSEYTAVKNIVKFTKGVIDIIDNLKWVLRYQTI